MAAPIGTTAATSAKKGGWFQKIPREILFSPGGVILIFLAAIIEIIDLLLPFPFVEYIIEIPLEIIFLVFLSIIANYSFKAVIIPFIIERIPGISDILPTWLLRMFI
jgi:hypothetical protein